LINGLQVLKNQTDLPTEDLPMRFLSATSLIAALLVSAPALSADTATEAAAKAAFKAFEAGEKSGNYRDFKALVSDQFNAYSHPLQPSRGVFKGAEAKSKMLELVAQREKTPNSLTFSEVVHHCAASTCLFQFNSEGQVGGGFPYKGYNVIALTVQNGKLTGFREYLGDLEPLWFQKK
jgi:hypothetical protein